MKPDHLKLASIVTLVCGAMSSMAAGATNADSLTMSAGRIIPMRSMTPDPATNGIDDDAQDGTAAPQGNAPEIAQTKDADAGPAAAENGSVARGAAPGIAYAASTLLWSGQDAGQVASAVPDSAHVPMMATVPIASLAAAEPVQDVAPVASAGEDSSRAPDVASLSAPQPAPTTNAVPDSTQASNAPAIWQQDVAAPSSAVSDSGDAPGVPAVSAPNVASTNSDFAGSARELKTASLAKQDVAPAIDSAEHAAQAPDATAVSSHDTTPTASSASDIAQVADASPAFAAQAPPAAAPVVPALASVRISTPVMPTSDVAPEPATTAGSVVASQMATAAPDVAETASPVVAPVSAIAPAKDNTATAKPALPAKVADATPVPGDGVLQRASVNLKVVMNPAGQPGNGALSAGSDARAFDVAGGSKTDTPVVAIYDSDPAWSSPDLVAVNENRLDNMRGGFDLPSGLVVSFGISRAAFVNGNLVSSTSFNIPNIAQMTPQQAQMLASANNGALVQNGLNNTVQPGGLPGVTGAVIQNTLSNQQIQALTTINTSVNSLSAFKAMNIGSTLNSALMNVVRPR